MRNLTKPKPVETTIDLGDGETVTVTFDRNRVTPAWVDEAERRDEARDSLLLPKAFAYPVQGGAAPGNHADRGAGSGRGKRLREYLVFSRLGIGESDAEAARPT